MYRRIEVPIDPHTAHPLGYDDFILHEALVEAGLPDVRRRRFKPIRGSARFFFTEQGWREFGHKILSAVRRRGRLARIISLKESDQRLDVIYRDRWQISVRFTGRR